MGVKTPGSQSFMNVRHQNIGSLPWHREYLRRFELALQSVAIPVSQRRDHNPEECTAFIAGAGLKRGTAYGKTDELGYRATRNPVTIYDLHATILYLFGLDHAWL